VSGSTSIAEAARAGETAGLASAMVCSSGCGRSLRWARHHDRVRFALSRWLELIGEMRRFI